MQNIGTLVGAAIRPNDSNDPIASAYANELKGGSHGYLTIAERDAIIVQRREFGMFCYVASDGVTYQLVRNVDDNLMNNNNWVVFEGGNNESTEWLDSINQVRTAEPSSPNDGDRYILGLSNTSPNPTGANWSSLPKKSLVTWHDLTSTWTVTPLRIGLTVKDDSMPNNFYTYNGATWDINYSKSIFYLEFHAVGTDVLANQTDFLYHTPSKDIVYVVKFHSLPTDEPFFIRIGETDIQIKKVTNTGLADVTAADLTTNLNYTMKYTGTNNVYQLDFPVILQGEDEGSGYIKEHIKEFETIVVAEGEQYWVYGDLILDGTLINNGHVVVASGAFVNNSDNFTNNGTLTLVDIKRPVINSTLTIGATYSMTPDGASYSLIVNNASLTPQHIKSNNVGTASQILSMASNGQFQWITNASSSTFTPAHELTINALVTSTENTHHYSTTESNTGFQFLGKDVFRCVLTGLSTMEIPSSYNFEYIVKCDYIKHGGVGNTFSGMALVEYTKI